MPSEMPIGSQKPAGAWAPSAFWYWLFGDAASCDAGRAGAGAQRAFDLMHRFLCAQYTMCARWRLLSLQPTGPPLRSRHPSLLSILRNVPAGSGEVGGQLLEEPSSGLADLSRRPGDGALELIAAARAC